jgi:hypothetical protein
MKLRTRSIWHCPERGIVENEIAWTKFYIGQLEMTMAFHQRRLTELEEIQAWWERFINYCHTGK